MRGYIYRVRLACKLMCTEKKEDFSIGLEVADAEKFDDIVIYIMIQKEKVVKHTALLIQTKHENFIAGVLKEEKCFTNEDSDFSLPMCYFSFTRLLKNKELAGQQNFEKLVFYTNKKIEKCKRKDEQLFTEWIDTNSLAFTLLSEGANVPQSWKFFPN